MLKVYVGIFPEKTAYKNGKTIDIYQLTKIKYILAPEKDLPEELKQIQVNGYFGEDCPEGFINCNEKLVSPPAPPGQFPPGPPGPDGPQGFKGLPGDCRTPSGVIIPDCDRTTGPPGGGGGPPKTYCGLLPASPPSNRVFRLSEAKQIEGVVVNKTHLAWQNSEAGFSPSFDASNGIFYPAYILPEDISQVNRSTTYVEEVNNDPSIIVNCGFSSLVQPDVTIGFPYLNFNLGSGIIKKFNKLHSLIYWGTRGVPPVDFLQTKSLFGSSVGCDPSASTICDCLINDTTPSPNTIDDICGGWNCTPSPPPPTCTAEQNPFFIPTNGEETYGNPSCIKPCCNIPDFPGQCCPPAVDSNGDPVPGQTSRWCCESEAVGSCGCPNIENSTSCCGCQHAGAAAAAGKTYAPKILRFHQCVWAQPSSSGSFQPRVGCKTCAHRCNVACPSTPPCDNCDFYAEVVGAGGGAAVDHLLAENDILFLTSTGALPFGLQTNTPYYVHKISRTVFAFKRRPSTWTEANTPHNCFRLRIGGTNSCGQQNLQNFSFGNGTHSAILKIDPFILGPDCCKAFLSSTMSNPSCVRNSDYLHGCTNGTCPSSICEEDLSLDIQQYCCTNKDSQWFRTVSGQKIYDGPCSIKFFEWLRSVGRYDANHEGQTIANIVNCASTGNGWVGQGANEQCQQHLYQQYSLKCNWKMACRPQDSSCTDSSGSANCNVECKPYFNGGELAKITPTGIDAGVSFARTCYCYDANDGTQFSTKCGNSGGIGWATPGRCLPFGINCGGCQECSNSNVVSTFVVNWDTLSDLNGNNTQYSELDPVTGKWRAKNESILKGTGCWKCRDMVSDSSVAGCDPVDTPFVEQIIQEQTSTSSCPKEVSVLSLASPNYKNEIKYLDFSITFKEHYIAEDDVTLIKCEISEDDLAIKMGQSVIFTDQKVVFTISDLPAGLQKDVVYYTVPMWYYESQNPGLGGSGSAGTATSETRRSFLLKPITGLCRTDLPECNACCNNNCINGFPNTCFSLDDNSCCGSDLSNPEQRKNFFDWLCIEYTGPKNGNNSIITTRPGKINTIRSSLTIAYNTLDPLDTTKPYGSTLGIHGDNILFIEGYGFGQGYKPPSISNKWLWTKVKIRQFEDCPQCTPAGDDPAGGGPTWWKYLHTPPREIYLHDAINLCPDGCWSKVGTEAVASDKKYDIVLGSSSIPIVTGIFNGIHRVGKLNGPNGSWNFLGGAANNDILCVGTVTSQEETNEFDLYVGGKFTNINGISANTIAKWNGTSWSSLGFGLSGSGAGIVPTVNSIVKTQNFSAIYATGIFTTANNAITVNNIAKWSGSTWSALGSGLTISGDATNAVGRTIIEDFDGNIIVGGSFNRAGSTNANNIAKWNGSTWSQLGSGLNGPVFGMTLLLDGNLIVVGSFTTAGGIPAKNIAKWNGSTWSALGSGLGTVNDVKNVTVIDRFAQEKIMVVGSFTTAGGVVSNGVAIWDGSSWSTINSGQNLSAGSSINKVLRYDDIGGDNVVKVYIVGDFNSLGSTSTPGGISKFGTTASEIDWQYYPFVFGSINPDGTTTLNTGGAADNSISVYAPTSDSSQYDQGGNTSRFMQVYVSNFNTNLRKWEPFELKAGLYDISIETWWYRPCGGTGQPPCPGVPGQQEVLAGQIFWKIKLDEQIFTRRYETVKQYTCTKTQTCGGPSGRGCSLVDASIYNNDNPTATYHFEEYKCEDFGPEGCGCGPSTDDVEDTDTVNREPPTISTVTPNEISTNGGSELTIQGTNFSTLESSKGVSLTTVWIGKEPLWYPATQETVSSTSLMTAIAPAIPDPGLKDLKVTTPFGTAIKTDAILYTLAAPIITSVKLKCCPQLPTEGSLEGGTRIIIKGFNFTTAPIPPATEPRASIVKIGNNLARQVVILNDKIIEATTPPASCNTCDGFVNVTVETPTGTAVCDNCFKYNTIPQSGCILDNIWTFGKYLKAFGLPDTVTEFGPDLKAFAMGIPTAPVSTGMPASSLVFVPIDPVCYANPSVRSIRLRNWWDVLGGGVGADPGGVLPTLKSRLLLRYGVNIDIPPSDSLGNFICNPGTQPNAPNGGACRNAPNNQICCPSTFLLTPEKCNFIEDSGGFNEGDKFIDIENSVVYTHNGNNWPTNGTRTSGG